MSGYAKGYGVMALFNGTEEREYTIGYIGEDADILLDGGALRVVKHPFDSVPRASTAEERAAVGMTW